VEYFKKPCGASWFHVNSAFVKSEQSIYKYFVKRVTNLSSFKLCGWYECNTEWEQNM